MVLFPVSAVSGDNNLFDSSNEDNLGLENSRNWTRRWITPASWKRDNTPGGWYVFCRASVWRMLLIEGNGVLWLRLSLITVFFASLCRNSQRICVFWVYGERAVITWPDNWCEIGHHRCFFFLPSLELINRTDLYPGRASCDQHTKLDSDEKAKVCKFPVREK